MKATQWRHNMWLLHVSYLEVHIKSNKLTRSCVTTLSISFSWIPLLHLLLSSHPFFLFYPQVLFVCRKRNPSVQRSQWWRFLQGWVGGCRGGRKGHLQISSINHPTHSNVTNILQLEETRRSSEPSISLIPHDHRFIRPCLRAEQTHTHTRTYTLKLHVYVCETVWWALWHGVYSDAQRALEWWQMTVVCLRVNERGRERKNV